MLENQGISTIHCFSKIHKRFIHGGLRRNKNLFIFASVPNPFEIKELEYLNLDNRFRIFCTLYPQITICSSVIGKYPKIGEKLAKIIFYIKIALTCIPSSAVTSRFISILGRFTVSNPLPTLVLGKIGSQRNHRRILFPSGFVRENRWFFPEIGEFSPLRSSFGGKRAVSRGMCLLTRRIVNAKEAADRNQH